MDNKKNEQITQTKMILRILFDSFTLASLLWFLLDDMISFGLVSSTTTFTVVVGSDLPPAFSFVTWIFLVGGGSMREMVR